MTFTVPEAARVGLDPDGRRPPFAGAAHDRLGLGH
ncbi:hypothetical protein GA0115243_101372 [Streptomyces sp. ScaeMP-e83]|nr:hypothetical protein GA0115243_101372 [Streptomyces sp. ScaeMP-e83]